MKFKIDICNELNEQKSRQINFQQNLLLKQAYAIINKKELKSEPTFLISNKNNTAIIEKPIKPYHQQNVFDIDDIKHVCVKHRLRFLQLATFKSKLSFDTKIAIEAFELEYETPKRYKLLTEKINFKSGLPLTQQLLFAEIANNEYYLIHSFGKQFSALRQLKYWPLRNIETIFATIFTLSFLMTLITPTVFINSRKDATYFSILTISYFFWSVIFFSSIFAYSILAFRKNLGDTDWENDELF